jgi:hypothetical protein
MATVLIRVSGYRIIAKTGHHYFTFQALAAVDSAFVMISLYFDQARGRRNEFSYDAPAFISDTDADELVTTVGQFITDAEAWITSRHAALSK